MTHGVAVQILRLFSESAGSIQGLKDNLGDARDLLGARHKQLHSQWCRSVTLRHVITLLDQIDKVAQVFIILFIFPCQAILLLYIT